MTTRALPLLSVLGLSLALASGAHAMPAARGGTKAAKPAAAKKARTTTRARAATPTNALRNPANARLAAIEKTKTLASAYAREHNFETRVIQVGPEGKKIDRVFVPITPETLTNFYTKFGTEGGQGSVVLRYSPIANGTPHVIMSLKPNDIYLWALNKNKGGSGNQYYRKSYHNMNGNAPQWGGASFAVYPKDLSALEAYLHQTDASGQKVCAENCMKWLPNAPTGEGRTLFNDLGITRSVDGRNIAAKIMHGGNHRVGVVGIHVRNLAEFKAMSNEQMLGALPQKKVDGQPATVTVDQIQVPGRGVHD